MQIFTNEFIMFLEVFKDWGKMLFPYFIASIFTLVVGYMLLFVVVNRKHVVKKLRKISA